MVTMKDVAQVMGVSVMTVSNAFNRPDQLSADLRERILARASKMGYTGPHAAARALRQGHSNAFGVVFADSLRYAFADPFTVEWLAGFAEAMESHGSSIVLMSVPHDDLAGSDALRNISIDGIAGACAVHPIMDAARRRGLPVVAGDPIGDDWVSIDEFAAGEGIGRHITDLGHRRVWILLGPPGERIPPAPYAVPVDAYAESIGHTGLEGWRRLEGILAGTRDADLTVLEATRWDRGTAEAAAAVALDQPERPTAVIALSDTMALGFMDAMAARGLTPGVDVSITGFDDVPEASDAGLTTVSQPIREKGRRSAELLLDRERTPRQVTLQHRIVVRRSTGPAPSPRRQP